MMCVRDIHSGTDTDELQLTGESANKANFCRDDYAFRPRVVTGSPCVSGAPVREHDAVKVDM